MIQPSSPLRCVLLAFVAALWLGTAQAAPRTEDHHARFKAALAAKDVKACDKILKDWARDQPEDPEFYIAAANYVLAPPPGAAVVISRKPAGPGDFVVADTKTGKPVGSISTPGPTVADFKTAKDLLKHGQEKAPRRIDIRLGRVQLCEMTGDTAGEVAVLGELAAYVRANPTGLLGQNGIPYPEPVTENLARSFSGCAERLFQKDTPENNKAFHDIAALAAETFPERKYGWNMLGIYYSTMQEDRARALECYEKALGLDPADSLVWANVGELRVRAGENDKAREAFEKVLALNNDAESVALAKKQLARLK